MVQVYQICPRSNVGIQWVQPSHCKFAVGGLHAWSQAGGLEEGLLQLRRYCPQLYLLAVTTPGSSRWSQGLGHNNNPRSKLKYTVRSRVHGFCDLRDNEGVLHWAVVTSCLLEFVQ